MDGAFACTCVGTASYLSPELVAGEPYGFPVDLWAAGCVLHELLFPGLPAFPAENLGAARSF